MQAAMLRRSQEHVRQLRLRLAHQRTALETSTAIIADLQRDLARLQMWATAQLHSDFEKLPAPHEIEQLLGEGYTPTERTRTIWTHFHRAYEAVVKITGGNIVKAAQLFDYASQRLQLSVDHVASRQLDVESALIDAIREFFVTARALTGNGRPPEKLAQAVQAVLTVVSRAVELGGVSMAALADKLELGKHGVENLSARMDASEAFFSEGLFEALFDDRCKLRSDAYTEEQIEWLVTECWLSDEFTRESEQKKHQVFDPKSRAKDRRHERLRWLELPLMEFYARVKEEGAEVAEQRGWKNFHPSSTFIRDHRPFWVKDPTRDVLPLPLPPSV